MRSLLEELHDLAVISSGELEKGELCRPHTLTQKFLRVDLEFLFGSQENLRFREARQLLLRLPNFREKSLAT